ncbi:cysteine and histidine-rich domain-containing protein [Cimex lectularius]|uniref:Cysteine and histidine-rich domain-containing protein n=1 Tax=Cimex lectularius TaxID=79782 RepID=A0A8I6RP54_CIMLE|nr:cysteine and histidine-rich domain-containing protein [Cimex lectularius]
MSAQNLLCYNSGCGMTFDPKENKEDSCRYHSGVPVFHDAYKGWSCCKKKCTDFTEFLNIKGCCLSYHSNVKPPEPEKPQNAVIEQEVIEVKPIMAQRLPRPPLDTPLVQIKPTVTDSLIKQLSLLTCEKQSSVQVDDNVLQIGTTCKNNSCKTVYEGPHTNETTCTYHSGVPIFHEGLKYWTCCMKKTTDFETFLSQVGCKTGDHVWTQKKLKAGDIKCRTDWHQTEKFVYFTIFGKKADPDNSTFEMNPIRIKFSLFFPEQSGSFEKDMELSGIIDIENSKVTMSPAKVEIQLRKKEPGSWSRFEAIKYEDSNDTKFKDSDKKEETSQIESVDLSCI